jgi:hypothetical protein
MPVSVVWRESGALKRRLKEVAAAVDPRAPRMDRLRTQLKKLAVEDNTEKLLGYGSGLAGIDRFGKPLAPLGAWAHGAAFRRRGNGPVLAPHGLGSRVITRFNVVWQRTGSQYQMISGWRDLPWMIFHLEGRPRGSKPSQPNWSLPKRDIGGISRRGLNKMAEAFSRFARNLLRSQGA